MNIEHLRIIAFNSDYVFKILNINIKNVSILIDAGEMKKKRNF